MPIQRPLKQPRLPSGASECERFWNRVIKADGCWFYGEDQPKRHALFWPTPGVSIGAHVYAWRLHYGDIPAGLFVLHSCDVGNCVRPDHLFLGTQQDNIDDCRAKGRHRPPPVHAGAEHPRPHAKLSESAVRAIRQAGPGSIVETAQSYGVSRRTIRDVLTGTTWRHLLAPGR